LRSDFRSCRSHMRQILRPWASSVFLSLSAVVTFVSYYSMGIISLETRKAIRMPVALFPTALSFDSYLDALSSANIPRWIFNSSVYSIVSVILVLLFASMAGYAFAKKRFAGRELIFWVFIA